MIRKVSAWFLALWARLFGVEAPRSALYRGVLPPLPPFDWHRWECEQWNLSRAFWFDPYRYAGTQLDWPEPAWAAYGRMIGQSSARGPVADDAVQRARMEPSYREWLVRQPDPLMADPKALV